MAEYLAGTVLVELDLHARNEGLVGRLIVDAAFCNAVRTATRSVGSLTTSKDSPRSLTSSAPSSSTAASTSSSSSCVLGHQDDALATEQVGHRTGVGQRPAVARHDGTNRAGSAVAVVGEAFDEHGHAARVHNPRT